MREVECILLNIQWTQRLITLGVNPDRVNHAIKFLCAFDQFVVGKLRTFARHVWQHAVQAITHQHNRIATRVFRLAEYFVRSEEHTSELQSRGHLVCRLLLEKKKKIKRTNKTQ